MAVTALQSDILNLLASRRRETGESYVAGGVALNHLLGAARLSSDIDLFHDTDEALAATWTADRAALLHAGFGLDVIREAPAFAEARVLRRGEATLVQWARDSAFRFFPLVEDDLLGLALHPFDLATNKVLALAGRLEPRDWIDTIECDAKVQPLGYLAWAACGKDPGFGPESLLADAARSHYSQAELDSLDTQGARPDAAVLGRRWHSIVAAARETCALLPAGELGKCVISTDCELFRGNPARLSECLNAGLVAFHAGRIGGAWPRIVA